MSKQINSHPLEPEASHPALHNVRRWLARVRRGFADCVRLVFGWAYVLLRVLGLFISGWLLLLAIVATLVACGSGHVVPGAVTGRHAEETGEGTTYHLQYSYRVGGETYEGTTSTWSDTYEDMANGTPVRVRTLSVFGCRHAWLVGLESDIMPIIVLWFSGPLGIIWCLSSLFGKRS